MNAHTKSALSATVIVFTILVVGYILYVQRTTLSVYEKRIQNYETIKHEYEVYRQKTRDLRKITVYSTQSNSVNTKVGDTIYKHVQKIDGDISVYYKNLTTNESIIIDGDKKYYMASFYKVILTLYILDQIKAGKTTFDSLVGDPPISTQQALQKIITESNNEYAESLAKTFGWNNIENAMTQKLGIEFSFGKDLQTTVNNFGTLLEEIALSLRISPADSEYLLRLLKDQEHTSKLPKYLPKNIYSHNKTGEFQDYSHDAGIFYTPKANYILIFMSKTKNPSTTNEEMALMSKDVYELLNGK